MGDLKREPGQRQTGIFGAGSDPQDVGIARRTIGVEPKTGCSQCGLGARRAQSPEPNVMAFARAIVDGLLKPNVLSAAEKIEGAERGGWIRRDQYESADHAP